MNLSCGEFAGVLQGCLLLAETRPLGGAAEPVGAMADIGGGWGRGDVVWLGETGDPTCDAMAAPLAFSRGARGVVTTRLVEPWPGGFVVLVPCLREAALAWWNWAAARFAGPLLGVRGDHAARPWARSLAPAALGPACRLDQLVARPSMTHREVLPIVESIRRASCCWATDGFWNFFVECRGSVLSREAIAVITRPVMASEREPIAWSLRLDEPTARDCRVVCEARRGGRLDIAAQRVAGGVEIDGQRLAAPAQLPLADLAIAYAAARQAGRKPGEIAKVLGRAARAA